MMRILHVHKAYPPVVGGIEHHLRTLAVAQARAGQLVTVLCCNTAARTVEEETDGVRIVRVARFGRLSSMPIGPTLGRWLRRIPADVVHVHTPFPLGEWLASRLPEGRPVVASWHSDIVRQRLLGALYRPLQRRFLARCNRIVVATPNHVTSSAMLPAFADKVSVVHYGIDVEAYAEPPDIALDVPKPFVLFVGRLVGYKGLPVLLEAWRAVQDMIRLDRPAGAPEDAWLVCVGRGPLAKRLREQARELEIEDRVRWIDYTDETTLRGLLHAATLLVLPSVSNNEAFGLVQLEAMACGTPVVATRLPTGVSYVNVHEQTGLLAEVGDAPSLAARIATLLLDEARRTAYGRAARERARAQFTIEQMVEGVQQAYRAAQESVA